MINVLELYLTTYDSITTRIYQGKEIANIIITSVYPIVIKQMILLSNDLQQ